MWTHVVISSIIRFSFVVTVFVALLCLSLTPVSAEWLTYDEGDPAHAGSGMRYQGVRFTLPDESVRANLRQVSFFYTTKATSCPVKVHITDHRLSSRLIPAISFDAINGWNFVDLTASNVFVPHNFYVVLENSSCGYPMLDNTDVSDRSFKGNHLKSLKTRLSHDLLIRAEVGEPLNLPVLKMWDISGTEKLTIHQAGMPVRKTVDEFAETWLLFDDSSLVIDGRIFGIWKQKKRAFTVSLDFEEVRERLFEFLSDVFSDELADIIVTKVSFSGTQQPDDTVRGTIKVFAKISFLENAIPAKVSIVRTYIGVPKNDNETLHEESQ